MDNTQIIIEYGEQDLKKILSETIKQEYINLKHEELTTLPKDK